MEHQSSGLALRPHSAFPHGRRAVLIFYDRHRFVTPDRRAAERRAALFPQQ
jgi:hypothetical protein